MEEEHRLPVRLSHHDVGVMRTPDVVAVPTSHAKHIRSASAHKVCTLTRATQRPMDVGKQAAKYVKKSLQDYKLGSCVDVVDVNISLCYVGKTAAMNLAADDNSSGVHTVNPLRDSVQEVCVEDEPNAVRRGSARDLPQGCTLGLIVRGHLGLTECISTRFPLCKG